MPQSVFGGESVFKVEEDQVIKVQPKKPKSIKDISVDDLKKLCFHNVKGTCMYMGCDPQPCFDICNLWICYKDNVINEFRKRGNNYYVDLLDVINKIECLKCFRIGDYNPFTRNTTQRGLGQYED